jgi:hypothetical protein
MTEEERQRLLHGLQNKWGKVNTDYTKTRFILDVGSLREKKEETERGLAQLEEDMAKLSHKNVFVGKF